MVDYNDGNWHGWNGGECPIHPQSVISVRFRDREEEGDHCDVKRAAIWDWSHHNVKCDIIAFRVIKPYVEPREWWLRLDRLGGVCGSDRVDGDPPPNWDSERTIHVREALE